MGDKADEDSASGRNVSSLTHCIIGWHFHYYIEGTDVFGVIHINAYLKRRFW